VRLAAVRRREEGRWLNCYCHLEAWHCCRLPASSTSYLLPLPSLSISLLPLLLLLLPPSHIPSNTTYTFTSPTSPPSTWRTRQTGTTPCACVPACACADLVSSHSPPPTHHHLPLHTNSPPCKDRSRLMCRVVGTNLPDDATIIPVHRFKATAARLPQ
jgi:hypothetical protein